MISQWDNYVGVDTVINHIIKPTELESHTTIECGNVVPRGTLIIVSSLLHSASGRSCLDVVTPFYVDMHYPRTHLQQPFLPK